MPSSRDPESIAALLQEAVRNHQAGRLAEAERAYDIVLQQAPRQGDALNLKGLIALDQGRIAEAVSLLDRAVKATPSHAPAFFNQGNALLAAGRSEEALTSYRKALALDPAFADAYLNMGVLLESLGKLADAIAAFRKAVSARRGDVRAQRNLALCLVKAHAAAQDSARDAIATEALAAFEAACASSPADASLLFDYGNFLAARNEHAKAIVQFEAALKLNPDWVEVLSNLGELLRCDKRFEKAVIAQRRALAIRPGDPIILTHLANALRKTEAYDEAERIYRDLMAADPNALLPYINLGNVYNDTDRPSAAIAMFEQALDRAPDFHEAYTSLGMVLADQGWHASSYLLHKKAVASKGADAETRINLAIIALSLGRFAEGWPGYENRFESQDSDLARRPLPPAYWRGEPLAGKGLLIWTEQGLGDEMLYAQMIPDVIEQGARCVIACSKRMVPIYARSFPECEVLGYQHSALEVIGGDQFDFQISIASLCGFLRPDFDKFPRRRGYLKADPAKTRALRAYYETLAQGRRIVGLSWRSKAPKGPSKSMALTDMTPLLRVPGVFFVNLQYGDCAEEMATVLRQTGVEIFQDTSVDPLTDMDAFLAQVAAMDLVITTSNTTAHAAGAQNVPVWVMLPHAKGALWYWFLHRAESPWYPSAKLIRQSRATLRHPWGQDVVAQAAERLSALKNAGL